MAATGLIFVEQKVLLQFAEVQHVTHLDANNQISQLIDLFKCVKSFEVHIKFPKIIPEKDVITDFFNKLYTIISCQQGDDSSDNITVVPKTEPLTDDVSDNDCSEPVRNLSKYDVQDDSEVKDEQTLHVLSKTVTPGHFTSRNEACNIEKSKKKMHPSHKTITDAVSADASMTVVSSHTGLADKSAHKCDGANVSNEEDVNIKPNDSKIKTIISGVRRSARHKRLPIKLNSDEFIGLEDAEAKSVKQTSGSKLAEKSETKSEQRTKKSVRLATKSDQLTTKSAESSETKSAKKLATKVAKCSAPIVADPPEASATKHTSAKRKSLTVVKPVDQAEPESPEKASEQNIFKRKAGSKSGRKAALKSLKSVRGRRGRPAKYKAVTLEETVAEEPVEKESDISGTDSKSSKAEVFVEENKDNSFEKSENSDTTELQYICAVCNLKFGEISKYVDHVTTHPEPKTDDRQCKECGLRLKTKSALVQHRRSHLPKPSGEVSCPTCGKMFLKKKYLKSHMLRHIGEKNVLCDACPARFYDRKGLYLHNNRVHLGKIKTLEAKFFCSYCPFKSYRQRDIDRHTVVHTKTKNYICDICGARLAHFTSLAIHKRLHSGKKPFRCNVCQKEFSQKISLQNHERIHTGERPFRCNQCYRSFQTSSHLSRHKITHSHELRFQCKYCNKCFARPFQVKRHVKDQHPDPNLESHALTYQYIKVEPESQEVSLPDELVLNDVQYESIVIEYLN